MSNYYKPQEPLQVGEDFIYPLSTTSQIIDEASGHRLDAEGIYKRDALSLEEIAASTNLEGKVASAEATKELNQTLANNTLIQPEVNTTNVSSFVGGYCTIGKIVIVNMRFTYIGNANALRTIFSNLPLPLYGEALTCCNWADDTATSEYAIVYTDGSVKVKVPTTNKEYIMSGTYMAR